MARVLSAARVRVAAGAEPAWLGTAGMLASRLAARGQHFWVFRNRTDARVLLAFREGASPAELAPANEAERSLHGRLHSLGAYEGDDDIWEAVALPAGE